MQGGVGTYRAASYTSDECNVKATIDIAATRNQGIFAVPARRYLLFLCAVLWPLTTSAQPQTYLFGRSSWSLSSTSPKAGASAVPRAGGMRSGGGSVGLALSELLIIRGSLNFSRGRSVEDRFIEEATPGESEFRLSDGDFSLLSGAAELLFNYNSEDRIAPYFVVGGGYYNGVRPPRAVDAILGETSPLGEFERTQSSFGITGGMGLRISMRKLSVFAESRALFGFVQRRQLLLPFNAGVALHLGRW